MLAWAYRRPISRSDRLVMARHVAQSADLRCDPVEDRSEARQKPSVAVGRRFVALGAEFRILRPVRPAVRARKPGAELVEQTEIVSHAGERPRRLPFVGG